MHRSWHIAFDLLAFVPRPRKKSVFYLVIIKIMISKTMLEPRYFDYVTVNSFFFEWHIDDQQAFSLFSHSVSFLVRGDNRRSNYLRSAIRRFFYAFPRNRARHRVFCSARCLLEAISFLDLEGEAEACTCVLVTSHSFTPFLSLSLSHFHSLTHAPKCGRITYP